MKEKEKGRSLFHQVDQRQPLIGNDLNRDLIENGRILNRWGDIFSHSWQIVVRV